MATVQPADFILTAAGDTGGRVYICQPGPERNVWTAYDVGPDGTLANPRVVFGPDQPAHWRGLPEHV